MIGINNGPGEYFNIVGVPNRVFGARSVNWLSMLFIPIAAIGFDVAGKVFSNMFYPTQTQIHIEIESREMAAKNRMRSRGNGHIEDVPQTPRATTSV